MRSLTATLPAEPALSRGASRRTWAAGAWRLEFDETEGAWVGLSFDGESILRGAASCELRGAAWPGSAIQFARWRATPDGLAISYAVTRPDGRTVELEETFAGFADRLERTLALRLSDAGPTLALMGVTLHLCGLRAGTDGATEVSLPMARSSPALSLETVRQLSGQGAYAGLETAGLDIGLAVALLSRREPPLQVAIIPLPQDTAVKSRLHAEGELSLIQEFACESWLEAGQTTPIAKQIFRGARRPWQEAVRAAGAGWAEQGYAPPVDRPAWAREAIIFEADPAFYGGLAKLTERLGELARIGFNTIYLLPWHRGNWNGYGTFRYDEMNPDYGTFADLRALCDEAHRRGLRVLFDLLVNVAGQDSPYPTEHPDWFYRDATGAILLHPTWRSWCLDPASPGFRAFLTDYTVRCCTEWGADGFRVDAAAYRGGNWQNRPGLQPHEHAHAIFTLLGEIRTAIRQHNPEAICLAECFGPTQTPISDLVAYQWITWLDWANAALLEGRLDGAALSRLLGEHFLALPRDTWLTGYTHTHDTVAFEKRDLDGPAVAAFFATLTLLCAGTMVFGGGWEMRARPSAAEEEEYQALFAVKTRLGGIASHELTLIECEETALLIAERPSRSGRVRVVTNFSAAVKPLPADGERIYSRLGSAAGVLHPFDTVVLAL